MTYITVDVPSFDLHAEPRSLQGRLRTRIEAQPPRRWAAPTCRTLPDLTDLAPLAGKRIICLLDEDNLRISLRRECRRRLRHDRLVGLLRGLATRLSAWAILTVPAGDMDRSRQMEAAGWGVLAFEHETVETAAGPVKKANADMDLCFEAGRLVRGGQFDALLLGTGDGDLAISVARGVRRSTRGADRGIYSLSVPGATSRRLRTRTDLFDGNILIGRDITDGPECH